MSNPKTTGTIKFFTWMPWAIGMFYLVFFLHIKGYCDRWYYYQTDQEGYAVNADEFNGPDYNKDNPAILKIGDFKAIKGLQAVPVKKGGKLPEHTNGVITLDVLLDAKRVQLKDAAIKVTGSLEELDKKAEKVKKEREKKGEITPQTKGASKDGYAVNSKTVKNASAEKPVSLNVVTGETIDGAQAILVKKGSPMPANADCIIGPNMAPEGSQTTAWVGDEQIKKLKDEKLTRIVVTTPFKILDADGGFAINEKSIEGASKNNPVLLKVTYKRDVNPGEAFPVKKGEILPLNVDTVIKKDALLDKSLASLQGGDELQVLVPWEMKDAKGFKYKDTFRHKGIKTLPIAALWNLLIVVGLGVSLGYMAEGFTDMIGIKLDKIQHHH